MNKELQPTPIDSELTRLLPLPVLMKGTDFNLTGENFHHNFHPRKSEELGYDPLTGEKFKIGDGRLIEGLAVRFSRGQQMPIWLHNRYHDTFSGPPLPQHPKDKFTSVVLACAGVVPRQAIDLYKPGEFSIVELTDKQHDFISQNIYYEGHDKHKRGPRNRIGQFLAEYTINNAVQPLLSERDIRGIVSKFLMPSNKYQRIAAGRQLLTCAIDASVAELMPVYKEAQSEKLVTKARKNLAKVITEFFVKDQFIAYYDPLEDVVRSAIQTI